jgi:8-oxo-dGTP pyrophosphatase MutT (NUDIX family)
MQVYENNKKICTNCGKLGHHFRMCTAPIISYGIIAFRITDPEWNQASSLSSTLEMDTISSELLEFLIIQRKDSIGFIELIRAKYKIQDVDYIRQQIEGTTPAEREMLITKSFQDLWKEIWGNDAENKHYRNDYFQAKQKFEQLTQGFYVDTTLITLKHLIETTPVLWTTPEWGFPKGRRNMYESDQECAIREFCEETMLTPSDFHILQTLEPIRETFIGNNNIHYEHVYYIAWISKEKNLIIKKNEAMAQEVGNIGWFSFENALKKIRSTNIEKREILLRTYKILQEVYPIFTPPFLRIEESTLNRSSNQDEPNDSCEPREHG